MATVNFIKNATQSATAMSRTLRYVKRNDKTRDKQFVSGWNCTPQLAEEEFLATRQAHRKSGGRWFYHYTQSFSPKENVTPELAHEIAREFAARAWPESEVVIATHVDAAHIHSHFVVNAVCFETGKMLRQHPDTLQKLRAISDELCASHGLSVLPRQQKKASGMTARKSITYTTPHGKPCRDNKLHESNIHAPAVLRHKGKRLAHGCLIAIFPGCPVRGEGNGMAVLCYGSEAFIA